MKTRTEYRVLSDPNAKPQARYRAQRRTVQSGLFGTGRWKEFMFDEGNWASGPELIRFSTQDEAMNACLDDEKLREQPAQKLKVVWSKPVA